MLALERDRRHLDRIRQSLQRFQACGGQAGPACHGTERLRIIESRDCGSPHRLERSGLRNGNDVAEVLEERQRREALSLGRVLEDAKGEVPQDSGGLLANGFVAVRSGRLSHEGRVDDLPHSRPADARVAILAGDRKQHILLIQRKFLDAGDPDQRVVALPLRQTSESIEQRHFSGSPACNAYRGAKAAS